MDMTASIAMLIKPHVDAAMAHQFRLELVHPHTRQRMTPVQREEFLTLAFAEIAKGMGIDRFLQTPAERLDQFAVMSVVKNHDTAGLLRSLLNSFMIAYGCPETADRAFAALLELEALRAEIADKRCQPTQKPALIAAATALKARLAEELPTHFAYRILYGADRLLVMADSPIPDLPTEINGVPVEFRAGGTLATTH